ncbi:MAG: 50S ribosomal protein L18 [Puniceicoccales bacterium]|jgi:large subunit ribosomal protein L18|nr:50S ribosomal protein L18 [Puniceicoccales bacterium]
MQLKQKIILREKRKARVRKHVRGSAEKLRLSVHFSSKHIYAQCIDDDAQKTFVFLSTLSKQCAVQKLASNVNGAAAMGAILGKMAVDAGIKAVVFDRGGRRYHGCVKAFADAVRNAGLEF